MGKALTCTDCALNGCERIDGPRPAFCPTNAFKLEEQDLLRQRLDDPENRRVIEAAAVAVHQAYWEKLSTLENVLLFARELGARTIGIAACVSLAAEARAAARVFEAHGFEVVGAICKIGCLTHEQAGIEVEGASPRSVLCNPMHQAQTLNDAHTDLNVVIGLCPGHDALFLKYSEALCTVLTSKDFKFDGCAIRALRADDPSGELARLL